MAGMFYSLREVTEKLKKNEEEIKQLVSKGRLREFRDGPNLLFKVTEVDALASEMVEEMGKAADENIGFEDIELDLAEEPKSGAKAAIEDFEPDFTEESMPQKGTEDDDLGLQLAGDESEINLAAEKTGAGTSKDELTSADTTAEIEGVSLLGETDLKSPQLDDTRGETKIESEEASLEQIEEDVNLDTFGSGSGLLDLSLQADDTSLGGILDEIYTSDKGAPAEAAPEASGMQADMAAASTEAILTESGLGSSGVAEAALAQPFGRAYVEIPPDKISNTLGVLMFLPVAVAIYTAIVLVSAFNGIKPSIMQPVQGIIWYIMGGAAALTLLIVGIAYMMSGSAGTEKKKKVEKPAPAPAKPKKEKKAKK